MFKYCQDSFPISVYPTKLKNKTKQNKSKRTTTKKKGEMNNVKLCVVQNAHKKYWKNLA